MNNLIFSPIEKGQLIEELAAAVADKIRKENQKNYPSLEDEYLTVKEVMILLKRSRNTISNWTREGILQEHEFNNSKYYLKSEILAAGRRKK
ncbi:hypothetical protein Belba_2153 [Belliella baltica DSM 15883]|uniref:Helix-turn-helix domain-containing protein n=1 Tax=Belliella baltica (strain DSM 15883 / CIP 108006 / LMG 21964 / BA134) TaxID=866536 RepID=I3Z652_BELBD|nr:helix-turn-helix domain-containing protein [Belliella baltica]AFL84720.1 hypothetical protein Belba_2153 [Belliella baltica DSM 15883]